TGPVGDARQAGARPEANDAEGVDDVAVRVVVAVRRAGDQDGTDDGSPGRPGGTRGPVAVTGGVGARGAGRPPVRPAVLVGGAEHRRAARRAEVCFDQGLLGRGGLVLVLPGIPRVVRVPQLVNVLLLDVRHDQDGPSGAGLAADPGRREGAVAVVVAV